MLAYKFYIKLLLVVTNFIVWDHT